MSPTYSLFELNEYIHRILALNFQESVWIRAEVAQLKGVRGNFFLDLIEKSDESKEVVAQISAVLWKSDWDQIRHKQAGLIDEIWREGVELRLRVWVDFHERYGLKLLIKEIDTTHTIGQIEIQRREVITLLQNKHLIELNKWKKLPVVVQRIAVITSQTAAGWQDFREHLANNGAAYRFEYQVFNTAMQGKNTEPDFLKAIEKINKNYLDFDCIVVLRGGGARLDLMGFDQFEVCKAIAEAKLPVITGIGHDVDETVADLVAFSAQKTPTAVADFLINHNALFENNIDFLSAQIQNYTRQQLHFAQNKLENLQNNLRWQILEKQRNAANQLDLCAQLLPSLARKVIFTQNLKIDTTEKIAHALDPTRLLNRGFSMTFLNKKLLKSTKSLKKGDKITTILSEGTFESVV